MNLSKLLKSEVHTQVSKRRFLTSYADDIEQDCFLRVWHKEEMPPEVEHWVRKAVQRETDAASKRVTRRSKKERVLEHTQDGPQTLDFDALSFRDTCEKLARNPFDVETLQVLAEQHPKYQSFSQYVDNQQHCSKTEAYRRRARLKKRIQDALV